MEDMIEEPSAKEDMECDRELIYGVLQFWRLLSFFLLVRSFVDPIVLDPTG